MKEDPENDLLACYRSGALRWRGSLLLRNRPQDARRPVSLQGGKRPVHPRLGPVLDMDPGFGHLGAVPRSDRRHPPMDIQHPLTRVRETLMVKKTLYRVLPRVLISLPVLGLSELILATGFAGLPRPIPVIPAWWLVLGIWAIGVIVITFLTFKEVRSEGEAETDQQPPVAVASRKPRNADPKVRLKRQRTRRRRKKKQK